jgi:CdiI immunity protein
MSGERFPSHEFPALRNFLRGYLHQDMKDEYGSVGEAARAFWTDATDEERTAVAREWKKFRELTKDRPRQQVQRILTTLGSSQLLRAEDIEALSAGFATER